MGTRESSSADKILTKTLTIYGRTYTITSEGRVFGKFGQPISIRPSTSGGYACFTAGTNRNRRSVKVHRIVAELFISNPNHYPEVDHRDGNRMNSRLDNLEWVPHDENVRRAFERKKLLAKVTGEQMHGCRLNPDLVLVVRYEHEYRNMSIRDIAKKHNLPWTTVSNAVKGKTWKHVPMPEATPEFEEIYRKMYQ